VSMSFKCPCHAMKLTRFYNYRS